MSLLRTGTCCDVTNVGRGERRDASCRCLGLGTCCDVTNFGSEGNVIAKSWDLLGRNQLWLWGKCHCLELGLAVM